jgi:hypothetical protein
MRPPTSPFLRGGNLKDSLGTTLNGLLERVPPEELARIKKAVQAEGFERGIVYEDDDGTPRPTPIMFRPRVLGGNQRAYLHRVTRVLEGAHAKLYRLWLQEPAVRRLLPLHEREERRIADLSQGRRPDEVFFGRFDCSTDFVSHDWVRSTQFFEFNPTGAGGIYVAPTVEDIILKHVVPALRRHAPTLLLESNDDPRSVLLEVLADHARWLKLKRFNIALAQYKDLVGGISEFHRLEAYFRSLGVEAWHVDPRELRLVEGELMYGDHPIDLVYRDHEINDMAAKEEKGESLAAEFDHKSAFQVFTSPEFAAHFTNDERRVFINHVPWTRIVEDARSTAPDGSEIELVKWLALTRDELVLKPNRAYGGEGVKIGRELEPRDWDAAIARAVGEPGQWVVQAYHPVAEKDFPVIDEDGNIGRAEYFSVLGLFASEQRLGILGRASRKKVVNVAQKGGVVAVLRLL